MCRVNFTPNGQSKIEINGYRTSQQLEVSYFKKYVANTVWIYDIQYKYAKTNYYFQELFINLGSDPVEINISPCRDGKYKFIEYN